jgi:hypothetical protein
MINMEENWKVVDFEKYCPLCEHEKDDENDDPCHDCLEIGARLYSHKPEYFKEKEK